MASASLFRDGVGAPLGQPLDYPLLKRQGRTCVRRVCRVKTDWPGNHAPPIYSLDFTAIEADRFLAASAGLAYILAVETTEDANQALWSDITTKGAYGRLDGLYESVASYVKPLVQKNIAVELFAGEPGWNLRDTAGLGSHDDQLRKSTQVNEAWQAHIIPKIRAIAPYTTLILNLPGRGHAWGVNGGEYRYTTKRWTNTWQSIHAYLFEFNHSGDAGRPQYGFNWPEPDWKTVMTTTKPTVNLNEVDYGFDRRPWTNEGIAAELDEIVAWQKQTGIVPYFAENGNTASCRELAPQQAYMRQFRFRLNERGWGGCEWYSDQV